MPVRDRDDVYMTAAELAARWRVSPQTLANQRATGTGLRYTKTPTGGVLYAVADVIGAEVAGTAGITAERVYEAIRSFAWIDRDQKSDLIRHVRHAMRSPEAS